MTTFNSSRPFRVALVAISASVRPPDAVVLSLAPYVLQSYAAWRLDKEGNGAATFQVFHYVEGVSVQQVEAEILDFEPDLVAFSAYIWSFQELLTVAGMIRAQRSGTVMVMGGPQASPLAEEVMRDHPGLDAVSHVVADGEVVFFRLVDALIRGQSLADVPGLVYRDESGRLQRTPPPDEPFDIDAAPSPYLDGSLVLDPKKTYTVTLESSRGCPFDCAYCFWGREGRKVGFFPLHRVLAEMDALLSMENVVRIYFADSDIMIKPVRTMAILQRMEASRARGRPLPDVSFELSISSYRKSSHEVIKALARLPDHLFTFAIQTVNPKALEHLGKHRPGPEVFVSKAAMLLEMAPDAGISIDIMLPLPGDNLQGVKDTLEFAFSLYRTHLKRVYVQYPVIVLPGTEFFYRRDELGIISPPNAPFAILETPTFPKAQVAQAYFLALWVELITSCFPHVFEALIACRDADPAVRSIDLMESWVNRIEKITPIMSPLTRMIETTSASVTNRNRLKGAILRKACETPAAAAVYAVVADDCTRLLGADAPLPILLGAELLSRMLHHGMDSLDQEGLKTTLPAMTSREMPGTPMEKLLDTLPRFVRVAGMVSDQDAVYASAMQDLQSTRIAPLDP